MHDVVEAVCWPVEAGFLARCVHSHKQNANASRQLSMITCGTHCIGLSPLYTSFSARAWVPRCVRGLTGALTAWENGMRGPKAPRPLQLVPQVARQGASIVHVQEIPKVVKQCVMLASEVEWAQSGALSAVSAD